MDLSVRPQDDFFRYVNGRWVDTTPIPGDLSAYGTFAILRERAQVAVREIIEAEGRAQAAPGSNSQKVGDLYKSFMDEAAHRVAGRLAAQRASSSRSRAFATAAICPRPLREPSRTGCGCPSR